MDINDFLDLEKRTICKLKCNIIVSNKLIWLNPSITFNIVEYINKVVKPEQIIVKEGELHNYKFRKIFKTLREFIAMYPDLNYSWDKSDDNNILEFSDELFTYHFDLRDTEVHSITFANPIDPKIGEIKVKDKRLRMRDYIDILDETILKRTGINTCELQEQYKRMVEKSFGINHVKNKEGLCK